MREQNSGRERHPAGESSRGQGSGTADRALGFYQRWISPPLHLLSSAFGLVPAGCRFQPTCSEYARTAITRHGLRKGSVLAGRRLLRCRPGSPGGFDPVP